MKPLPAQKRRLLLGLIIVLPLVCIAGIVIIFTRLYQRDMQSLTDFMVAYQAYDHAMAEASVTVFNASGKYSSATSAEERLADMALSDLKSKSSVPMSSLIKNEKEAMRVMQEITDLSETEMTTLKAYQHITDPDINRNSHANTFHDLMKERQAAFAYFQQLSR